MFISAVTVLHAWLTEASLPSAIRGEFYGRGWDMEFEPGWKRLECEMRVKIDKARISLTVSVDGNKLLVLENAKYYISVDGSNYQLKVDESVMTEALRRTNDVGEIYGTVRPDGFALEMRSNVLRLEVRNVENCLVFQIMADRYKF
jgi:hypothetical protein